MLTLLATALVSSTVVLAQGGAFTPLASQSFTYTALPYQADPNTGERGHQYGYNICNSTTQGQESLCQTAIINSIDDFCLWGPPEPNSLIGDTEGEAVAWCTKGGHGTRVIPEGALTGVQFMRTPDYIQVTGHIRQERINIAADDSGGEMDPHGADQRGNPLGGLLFSNAWGGGYVQAIEWHNFMGGGVFCLKACDPRGPNAARFCEHIFDRIGCAYNAPAAYEDGVFESCLGENQDFPGIYTSNGVVMTYTQPPESLGPISVRPYEPRIPASSSCTPYTSSALYTDAPPATGAAASSSSTTSRASTSTPRSTATRSTTGTSASATSTPGAGFVGASVSLSALLAGFFAFAVAL
ncbi:SubName: Full=Uncharacterized protein {ECO:0000313/EMBL:CCA70589.1} [Serendipita indica DSM 11827]|nr:SubName: Full=Uncharacterized protein {ECO:0000313/EMBL:CCA70589.1} [Serendipita indica DSM 11827]